ncbi:MAG: trypsin-like peptidase domain-containing protein [Planctomycetota bacterium]
MRDRRWLAGLCAVLILAGAARAGDAPARDYSALYKKCAPSVVMVTSVETFPAGLANRTGELIRPLPLIRIPIDVLDFVFYPLDAMLRGPRKWGGSGVIIDKEGHFLTNHHVVDGGDVFWAELHDRRLLRAKLIGSDEAEDYALLKLDLQGGEVTPARLGDSSKLAIGNLVLAVGSPLRLRQSLAVGVVAGVERRIPKGIGGVRGDFQDYVQTDLTIGFGSSGGALFNENAELIGLTTLMVAEGETGGVTFSVPINVVKEGIPKLKEHGEVIRGYIGAHIKDVTPRLIDELDLQVSSGACICGVGALRFHATPAEKAGLRRGDVVTEYKPSDKALKIDRARTLARAVLNTKPGTEVTITFVRGEDERKTRLTVEER